MEFVNIAAYRFVDLPEPERLRGPLEACCSGPGLRGTILLSTEGINLMLAGPRRAVEAATDGLETIPQFTGLAYRESCSDIQPFPRLKIRVRDEIISMGEERIRPAGFTGPRISPEELRRWLDEGREFTLLDTRNDYEVMLGTFECATALPIGRFRDFPAAVRALPAEARTRPIVMFCTGGIRCEKASPLLLGEGFGEVYQLDGGILNYFRECGGRHWQGECFVFDRRVGLTPDLRPTRTRLCRHCQRPLGNHGDCQACGG